MKPRWSLLLMFGGVVLILLTVLPQKWSRRFDRGGASASSSPAYYAIPQAQGFLVTSADDDAAWQTVLDTDGGNMLDVAAEWKLESHGLWINLLERESVNLTPRTKFDDRPALQLPAPDVLRKAALEYACREPAEATDWLARQTSPARFVQLLQGHHTRIIWPNVALLLLQVAMVCSGFFVIWRGWRELNAWRADQDKRCASCGYSNVGLGRTDRCPECGEAWSVYD